MTTTTMSKARCAARPHNDDASSVHVDTWKRKRIRANEFGDQPSCGRANTKESRNAANVNDLPWTPHAGSCPCELTNKATDSQREAVTTHHSVAEHDAYHTHTAHNTRWRLVASLIQTYLTTLRCRAGNCLEIIANLATVNFPSTRRFPTREKRQTSARNK